MPPKSKKTKAEEAADFLSTLDLDVPEESDATPVQPAAATSTGQAPAGSRPATPAASRISTDADRRTSSDSKRSSKIIDGAGRSSPAPPQGQNPNQQNDDEAQKALDFLEAQINTKRAPLSVPGPASLRTASPLSGGAGASRVKSDASATTAEAVNVPSSSASAPDNAAGGWGGWWSSASNAIQSAQKIADEGYRKVRTEGVAGLEGVKVGGVDLGSLRKGAEERLKGMQIQGIDLDKLRHDLVHNTQSALTQLINTVAPPISAHETLELWLSHPMIGYAGVEGVVYRAWMSILDQTESGELVVVWSPPPASAGLEERGLYPADGWTAGWELVKKEVEGVKAREAKEPVGRAKQNPDVPVTIVPIFLHLQPLLAPLSIPEPPLLLPGDAADAASSTATKGEKKHLHFIITLHDPSHSLQFSTTTQPTPADWLDVEYERSDWVEERLVDVLRTGVEILAQDYVATRMGLKTATQESGNAEAEAPPVAEDKAGKDVASA